MTIDADAAADTTTAEEDRAAEQQAQSDFESGMPPEPAKPTRGATPDAAAKPEAKPETKPAAAAPPAAVKPPEPKYVRVTEDQFATWNAAAAKAASYEAQFSKAFGTIGGIQKTLTTLQTAAPRAGKFEIPKDAFADMERDFPELAAQYRKGLEATLRGFTGAPGAAELDPELMKRLVVEHATEARVNAEIESLNDEFPEWRKIVGQVDIAKQAPDKANPFRAWLATKDATYQARLNGTNSAAVISRAIERFQSETKAPAVTATPSLKAQLQAARIKGAIQPRGDGGQAAPSRTDDDDFAAGFAAG